MQQEDNKNTKGSHNMNEGRWGQVSYNESGGSNYYSKDSGSYQRDDDDRKYKSRDRHYSSRDRERDSRDRERGRHSHRSRSPYDAEHESRRREARARKRRKTLWDVGPQQIAEMTIPGAAFGIVPVGSGRNPTTGQIQQPKPYTNSFGVLVTPPGYNPDSNPTPISGNDKQQRRVYVGNIPKDCTEEELIFFFNDVMMRAFASEVEGNCVQQATINMEKSFAFLDFHTADDATRAMALDGLKFRESHILKIRRPKDYKSPNGGDPSARLDKSNIGNVPGLVSTNVPDGPNKLFIGGLPSHMSEDQVLRFLSVFGPLKAFNLVKDIHSGLSRGYAFCEYANGDKDTDEAIKGMNGVEMNGKKLLVQRASIGAKTPELQNAMDEMMGESTKQLDPEKAVIANILNLGTRVETALAMVAQTGELHLDATKILVLLNCILEQELLKDNVYHEILNDIKQECLKYGPVTQVVIPRPSSDWTPDEPSMQKDPGVGKVFVEFKGVQQAQTAQQALAGKRYQGRIVVTTYCSEDSFYSKQYM